ncbi:MAG: hypothetical protein IKN02_00385 [Prevotella sp.]|nr:hypothetical protein [Prevotella sp.]
MNKQLLKFVCILSVLLCLTISINADVFGGTIKIMLGQENTINLPDAWVYELQNAHSINTYLPWGTSNSQLKIRRNQRYGCVIYADQLSEGAELTYRMSYLDNNWIYRELIIYWNVIVNQNTQPDTSQNYNIEEFGNEPIDNWSNSGNYSISWYNKNLSEFTISNNKELAGMAYLVNNGYTDFDGKVIHLSSDIDLNGKKWKSCKTFKGRFDGHKHTIQGIYICIDDESQQKYGFWQTLEKASVSNVILEGVANFSCKQNSRSAQAGAMAGYIKDCQIENCNVSIDVYFNKEESFDGETNYLGGFFGRIEGGCVKYCGFYGNIKCTLPNAISPSNVFIGGIAGYSSIGIEYCETISSSIQLIDNGQNFNIRTIKGIGGNDAKYCRSIIDKIDINNTNSPSMNVNRVGYAIEGIGSGDVTNCYSTINRISLYSKYPKTSFYFGGIGNIDKSKSSLASFSNNDIKIETNEVMEKGSGNYVYKDGSTAFSSEQMQSSAFLEELNMYSVLELDGPIWTQPVDGGYPYIAKLYETSAVEPLRIIDTKDAPVYSLSGQRLAAPRKGLNIRGGKKIIVK